MKWSELSEGLEDKIKEVLFDFYLDKHEGISFTELYVPNCEDLEFEFGDKIYNISAKADVPYFQCSREEYVCCRSVQGEVRFFDIYINSYDKITEEEDEMWVSDDYTFDISD